MAMSKLIHKYAHQSAESNINRLTKTDKWQLIAALMKVERSRMKRWRKDKQTGYKARWSITEKRKNRKNKNRKSQKSKPVSDWEWGVARQKVDWGWQQKPETQIEFGEKDKEKRPLQKIGRFIRFSNGLRLRWHRSRNNLGLY